MPDENLGALQPIEDLPGCNVLKFLETPAKGKRTVEVGEEAAEK